ncbi:group III truncated hemoglobin [Azospirillum rugosum]|uniref:Hemoglobin n=1 Tax=Azospirillum rugosum TaxID=416170 RepID=A0ABS4SDI4_9PROT|nr:group III truncated hemoglobin [Azospirillum rugosum]MBP2290642.1 hemoglobin [Azospirillum rugosum]MDQ0525530.1 hemoglobin [Azospirillum rugosum]
MPDTMTGEANPALTPEAIAALVRRFYDAARADPVLGPSFAGVADWEEHFEVIERFWASALLGTKSYKGNPFMAHVNLDLTPESFTRWLALFKDAADAVLPPAYAEQAVAKANHMARSLTAGLFTIPGRKYQPPAYAE